MDLAHQQLNRISVSYSKQIIEQAELWIRNYRTRRRLSQLDDRMLRDVGIDPITADREANKKFWQD